MTAKHLAITVRLNESLQRMVGRAAAVQGKAFTAFVEGATEELARRVLMEWAIDRCIQNDRSFSELAEETGLTVEEIMIAMEGIGDRDRAAALAALWERTQGEASAMFLAGAASIARIDQNPAFLRRAERTASAARTPECHSEQMDNS